MESEDIFSRSSSATTKTGNSHEWWSDSQSAGGPPGPGVKVAVVVIILGLGVAWFLLSESTPRLLILILELVGAAAIVFAAVYTNRHREWLILALVLVEANLAGLLGGTARSAVHYGLLALFCIPCIPFAWRSNLWRQGVFRLYLIFFAWAALSISWSLAPYFSIARLTGTVLVFCAIIAIVANLKDRADVSQLMWRYLEACGFLVIVIASSAILLPHSITWSDPTEVALEGQISRFQGIFDNPNAVGALMLYTVTPILAFWSSFNRLQKMVLSLIVVLAFGAGALADSRSPFAALTVGCLLFVLWRYRAKGLLVLIGVIVVAIAALPIFGGYIGEYVGGRDVGTLTGRTDIWAFALQQLREHPIRGYGYQSSGAIFQSRYFTEWYGPWDEGAQSSLHNGYLTQAVGVGVPAAIFWLYILVRPFVFLFTSKEDPWNLKPVFFLVVVPMLTLNLTEASLEGFLGLDGILFGLIWGAAEIYRLSAEEKERIAREEAIARAPFGFVSS